MENKTKCPLCGNSNVESKTGQSYHFTESGLDNVYLVNVETSHCPDCGAGSVSIPQSPQLLNCLGEAIVLSSGLLSGPEVRFLRKNLHIKINDFAKLLGVARGTLSRWENGQIRITRSNDLLIRSIYLFKGPGMGNEVRDEFRKWLEKQHARKRKRINLRLPLDRFSCVPAIACSQ